MVWDRDAPLIIGLLALFVVAVLLAAAETSLLRVRPTRVEVVASEGGRSGRRLLALLSDLDLVLNAVLLAALLSQVGAATLAGTLTDRWFGAVGVTIGSIALTVVLFIYAEAIPKTYAMRHPVRVALALSGPVRGLEVVLRPVIRILVGAANLQMPGRGATAAPIVTEDELRVIAGAAEEQGEITPDDRDLIEKAFRLGDRRVDDVMVPRSDVVAVPATSSARSALQRALEAGHRRLPVFGSDVDDISGFVTMRVLAGLPPDRGDLEVGALADPCLAVPESRPVLSLLREMQRSGIHLAIVVDEFGGTAGLCTVEDIVEELLGSIREDPAATPVEIAGAGRWVVDGTLPVEDLADLTGEPLPEGEWNTVAGLAMGVAGRLLEVGEFVDVGAIRLRVVSTRRRRILRVEATGRGHAP